MGKKVPFIYTHDIIKQLRIDALATEKTLALRLKQTLKAYGITTKYRSLDNLLTLLVGQPIDKLPDNWRAKKVKGLNREDRVKIMIEGEEPIILTEKISSEYLEAYQNNKNKGITGDNLKNMMAGFVYEDKVFHKIDDKISDMVLSQITTNGIGTAKYMRTNQGKTKGGFDIQISLPYGQDISALTKEQISAIKKGLNLDVKTQSSKFPIATASEAGNQYLKSLKKDIENSKTQLQLFPMETLEELIAINLLNYKLGKNNFPVYYGATDGGFVLSSQILDSKYGDLEVDYDMPNENGVASATEKQLKGQEPTPDIVYNVVSDVMIDKLKNRSLWYIGKNTKGGK